MNLQPGCKEISRFIEVIEYFSLLQQQRLQSFIGEELSIWADEALDKRVKELEELERNGFVFFGEKNWIHKFVKNDRSENYNTYGQWVADNFANFLGVCFVSDENHQSVMDKKWKATLPASKYLLGFNELNNPAYSKIEDLELCVGGDSLAPSSMHLCSLFNSLTSLEYSIFTFSHDTKGYEPLNIIGVDATNNIDPYRILLNVISEYGSEFTKTVVLGEAWRR